jgi:hypothetical protein
MKKRQAKKARRPRTQIVEWSHRAEVFLYEYGDIKEEKICISNDESEMIFHASDARKLAAWLEKAADYLEEKNK